MPIFAQTPLILGDQQGGRILKSGTSIPLKLVNELTTKGGRLRPGDRFDLEVSDPVTLNNQIIIPMGSVAVGEVTSIRNRAAQGRPAAIGGRVLYVRANGQQIRWKGGLYGESQARSSALAGAAIVLPLPGLFSIGGSATIPVGTRVMAYLDEDLPLPLADGATSSPKVGVSTTTK